MQEVDVTTSGPALDCECLRAAVERLQERLRGVGANRYWEGRWRDEKVENERLRASLSNAVEVQLKLQAEIERLRVFVGGLGQ
jgi:hypothetical protein